MKHWLASCALVCFCANANALWQGKLDLASSPSAVIIRELHDGQWNAGLARPNLWHLDHNGVERFHAGLYSSWNAEHGNFSFGPMFGVNIPVGASANILSAIPDWSASPYFSAAVSLDSFVGYRPVHTKDVIGELTYGLGAVLSISFGTKELINGTH